MKRQIVINVDDLGLSEAVNQAVVNLAEKQRIHSTSYMVGGNISDAHRQALDRLGIDIGLHLDFTGIFPSPLTRPLKSLLIDTYARRLDVQQVRNNIAQQFELFEATFQRPPAFVDGHQHAHQFPIIRQALIAEMHARYGSRITSRVTVPVDYDFKAWVIYSLGGRAWHSLCQRHGIATNTRFAGVYDFNADMARLRALWKKWLSHHNVLIMCHPAVPSDDWQDEIKPARELDYQWLMSDEFAEYIELPSDGMT